MGWSTELFCNITFNKQTYNTLYEVKDRIEELTQEIDYYKNILRNYAMMTEPNKMLSLEEGESPIDKISISLNNIFEGLEDAYTERYKLYILEENWSECHNEEGLAINPPENINWKTAFLDGDFIKSIKYSNGYE